MNYKQVVAHFRGLSRAAQVIGVERQNVHNWGKPGRRIPSRWQLKFEQESGGALKADAQARRDAIDMAQYVFRDRWA